MMFFVFFKFLLLILPVMLGVAFITLLERKVLSIIGYRLGPNKVSIFGLLQPIGDALKLSNKQVNLISNFSFFFYYISSIFMIFSSLILWNCFFSTPDSFLFKFSILIFLLFLGFNSFNSVLSGWSTFSKFSLIGTIRTVAQLISYEAALYMCLFFIFYMFFSFSFNNFCFYVIENIFIFFPFVFYCWFPCFLAELNRTPYDFSEGESELVSGFNTEFGSSCFTLIFLAEYSNIIFFSLLSSFIFFWLNAPIFFFFFFFFLLFGFVLFFHVFVLMSWWCYLENFWFLF